MGTFDQIVPQQTNQSYVYQSSVWLQIDCILQDDHNATALPYGQTGSFIFVVSLYPLRRGRHLSTKALTPETHIIRKNKKGARNNSINEGNNDSQRRGNCACKSNPGTTTPGHSGTHDSHADDFRVAKDGTTLVDSTGNLYLKHMAVGKSKQIKSLKEQLRLAVAKTKTNKTRNGLVCG
eukprot:10554271-Ditylum_brightwellii.AAC.1